MIIMAIMAAKGTTSTTIPTGRIMIGTGVMATTTLTTTAVPATSIEMAADPVGAEAAKDRAEIAISW
jgi:hypothetical protein